MSAEAARTGLRGLLPEIRPSERIRFRFFLSLSGLLALAQTLGIVAAESIFLARLGAERLPLAFVLASGVAVGGSLGYAVLVARARNDLLFGQLLLGGAAVLVPLALASGYGLAWAPTALLCVYYLTSCVFLNHFWTFAGDYFDTLASKRLFPLFQIGSSVGGLVGGAVTVLGARFASPEVLIYGWSGSLLLAMLLVLGARRRLHLWYPVDLEERDESSVQGIRVAARYLRRSGLGRALMVSTAGMVLALFVLQYLYSGIFARTFPDEATLATFFGLYLAVTNLMEIFAEGILTPRLLQRLGVGSANLVHPVLTLLSFGLLAVDQRLYAAMLGRMNREMLESALAGPVRALVQNALPARLRGMVRAFLEGMVVHAGMVLAGGLLIAIGPVSDPVRVCLAGGAAAALYLGANVRVRRGYLESLVSDVRSGRIDIRERSEDLAALPVERLKSLWTSMLAEGGALAPRAVRQLARTLARRGESEALRGAVSHSSPGVRRAAIEALASAPGDPGQEGIRRALDDPEAEVRLSAVLAWAGRAREDPRWELDPLRARLQDPDPRVRAAAARSLGEEGRDVLARMVREGDPASAIAAMDALPATIVDLALERADDSRPRIRAAAIEALARLPRPVPLEVGRLATDLDHPDSLVRRAAVRGLATRPEPAAGAEIARALADPSREVRLAAAAALATLGKHGVGLALGALENRPRWAAEAGLLAIARSGTPLLQTILADQLRLRARQAWNAFTVCQVLPSGGGDLASRFVRAAYEDALVENRKLAFRILEHMGDPAVVRTVEKALLFSTGRRRAAALEVLSHLGDREGTHYLVMTLERLYLPEASVEPKPPTVPADLASILREAVRALDRWIRIASTGPGDRKMEVTMERLLALRNVPLFEEMSLDQLEAINTLLAEQQFVSGEVIFREADPGTDLFLVVSGVVDIVQSHATEHAITLARLGPGSHFGEIAVLDEATRTASAVAAEDCTLLALSGERFRELIHDMPEIAFAIFRVLTGQVRRADERLAILVRRRRAGDLSPSDRSG